MKDETIGGLGEIVLGSFNGVLAKYTIQGFYEYYYPYLSSGEAGVNLISEAGCCFFIATVTSTLSALLIYDGGRRIYNSLKKSHFHNKNGGKRMKKKNNVLRKHYQEILSKSYEWNLPFRIEKVLEHPEFEDYIKNSIKFHNLNIRKDLDNGRNPLWNAAALENLLNNDFFKEKYFKGKSLDAHRLLAPLAEESKNYGALCAYINFCEKN